jgi:hypothetical protein
VIESNVLQFPRSRIIRTAPACHIEVVSRHDVIAEIEGMRAMLGLMWDADVLSSIDRVECNSKAAPAFSVRLRPMAPSELTSVAWSVAKAARQVFGGHNGITVEAAEGKSLFIEPEWPQPAA